MLLAWELVRYGISILVPCSGPPPLLGLFMQQKDKKKPPQTKPKTLQAKAETRVQTGDAMVILRPVCPEICRVQRSLKVALIFLLVLVPNRPSASRGFMKSCRDCGLPNRGIYIESSLCCACKCHGNCVFGVVKEKRQAPLPSCLLAQEPVVKWDIGFSLCFGLINIEWSLGL